MGCVVLACSEGTGRSLLSLRGVCLRFLDQDTTRDCLPDLNALQVSCIFCCSSFTLALFHSTTFSHHNLLNRQHSPSMADITHYTLRDLQAFALERCALGLRILSDTSQYEFERKVVFQQSTMTARECDLLYVGYYYNRPNDRVYADLDYFTGQIVYYDGQKDVNISAASEARKIYTKSSCFSRELMHIEPFRAIGHLNTAKGSRRVPKTVAQVQTRNKLTLLIKFAYLLTGRVSSISPDSPEEFDVRDEFVKLCTAVQKREDEMERAVKKEPVKPKNNLGGMSGNSEQSSKHNAWTYQPQGAAEGALDLAIRASKRKFIDLTISDNEAESSMQGT
jgi:hypothetical protein